MRLGSRPALINVETQVSHYRLIRRFGAALALVVALYSLAGAAVVFADAPVTLSQGLNWNSAAARDFYSRDQGSRIMPLKWITALQQINGQPFMTDALARYGYLKNDVSDPPGLPIGFTVAGSGNSQIIGMTCAACHTRQIEAEGKTYRIDGGPALVDFQRFLADLDAAMNKVLADQPTFLGFAHAVLGSTSTPDQQATLRKSVADWFLPFHTIIQRGLPKNAWGVGRADAVGMIFNRVTGLDIGTTTDHVIAKNVREASAPTRYPFLWNAAIQDKTQWPGFAKNGTDKLALARNLGEVYGVFAEFHPRKESSRLLGVNYLADNSVNFSGLKALEDLIRKISPPKWPWAVDAALAGEGKKIFNRHTANGGCTDCHGIQRNLDKTWKTPLLDVGTDSREYEVMSWTADSGVLSGASIPFAVPPLKPNENAFNILHVAVAGSILQHDLPLVMAAETKAHALLPGSPVALLTRRISGAFVLAPQVAGTPQFKYEARVMEGIWAAAPYLHNGSVPTLAELLKPSKDRVATFKVGPAYDTVNVGIAVDQPGLNSITATTDCGARNSGNSRCGHPYGTALMPAEKKALLEYLKTL